MLEGVLRRIWTPPEGAESVLHRLADHQAALRPMLSIVRVFVCRAKHERPLRQRIESALITALRKNPAAESFLENERLSVCIVDGHFLVSVVGSQQIFGLPESLHV